MITPNPNTDPKKQEILKVENKKHEHRLMETYIRRTHMMLFSYNPKDKSHKLVDEIQDHSVHVVGTREGYMDFSKNNLKVDDYDPNLIYFESINKRSAQKRIDRYLRGTLKDLCNLRIDPGVSIDPFKR